MKEEIEKIQKMADSVDGFLTQDGKYGKEGEVLFHLARKSPLGGSIVEIGSWKGKSTTWLGKGGEKSQSKVYAIDPHLGSSEHKADGKDIWTFDEFKKNISKMGLDRRVIPIVKKSSEATSDVKEPISLLFIDGAHEYEAVNEDFTLWFPKVKEGGVIAFHDSFTGWPDVRRLVHAKVYRSSFFAKVRYINGITYATKVKRASFWEQFENRIALIIKCFHEKSENLPQPFKSLSRRFIWRPFQKKWLSELEKEVS